MSVNIPKRIASTIINSLKGGVVPRTGLSYITVGRKAEIDALLNDIDIIADGERPSDSSKADTGAANPSCSRQ